MISNIYKPRSALGVLSGMLLANGVFAAGQVTSIQTSVKSASPFTYTAKGIEYQWGMGDNQLMEGFTKDGDAFGFALSADRVAIVRDDIEGVTTGEPCGLFVERLSDGDASRQFAADYPSDGSGTGNCDIEALLASRVLNRGAVDLFSNKLPDAKNIERLDYLFDYGVLAPFSEDALALAGHVAAEKASNNELKIAAILKLDVFGQPASYGPMVLIDTLGCTDPALCYGSTDIQHAYSFLQNEYNKPQSYPTETERSYESIGMAFVSAADLGLTAGQRYYGFSFFADDVIEGQHDLLDPTTFPDDTANEHGVIGDDADVYGGLSGYFVANALSVTVGAVFLDINGNGEPDESEAGISDISITLYEDVNGNGVLDIGVDQPLGDSIDSDMSGNFVLPGIPDGHYIVVMDEADPELPPDLEVAPGSNPHPFSVAGNDSDPVYFPFIDPNGSTDGGTDSGTDDGTSDGGADSGSDDGGSDGGVPPINDDATNAVDDEFEVNQGQSATFDVLLNDFDGTGNGLSLVSVSESPNATITIVNNEVNYRPNFGFYGTDSFYYVMADSDGSQSTGNVVVDVLRYSDLNNNQLNDYVECNCDSLELETGIHGSGVGGLSLHAIWLLLLSIGMRRRCVRTLIRQCLKGAVQ